MNRLLILLISLSLSNSVVGAIGIGSKTFTENILLAEMLGQVLEENYNVKVVRSLGLGGTKVAFDALTGGDIDVYPDYTGTGYVMILKQNGETNPDRIYQIVKREFKKQFDLRWSRPIGFNNTYAVAVRRSDPRFKEVTKVSELSDHLAKLSFAAPHEFMERPDGFRAFVNKYNLEFDESRNKVMDAGLMYDAINDKSVDMIMSYSTDGRILAYDLKLLEDDLQFFPPYYAAFVTREDALEKNPYLGQAISLLEGRIDEETMIKLNDEVDRLKREPSDVARNFLVNQGIIEADLIKHQEVVGIFDYVKNKKTYLLKITKQHIYLSATALLMALILSLPVGILLSRKPEFSKYIFPIINTIQTIPSLALFGFLIPFMGIGFGPALIALFLYSLLPLIRNTYEGIRGVDRNFIEASRGMGLTEWQILRVVEIPLAMPIIMAGIRTATVIIIGTATLAALVGAGGLGDPIFRGVATVNSKLIMLGAIPSALMAILADKGLGMIEKRLVSKGIVLKSKR